MDGQVLAVSVGRARLVVTVHNSQNVLREALEHIGNSIVRKKCYCIGMASVHNLYIIDDR